MSIARISLTIGVLLIALVSRASAQDAGQIALVAAFPGSAGVQWQIADRWAVRVDGSYAYSKAVTDSGDASPVGTTTPPQVFPSLQLSTHTETRSHTSTIGVSALITVHQRDSMRVYLAPRFSVGLSSLTAVTTSEFVNMPPGVVLPGLNDLLGPRTLEESVRTPAGGASLGASTKIGDRLGVFGEVGVNYSRSDSPIASSIPVDAVRTSVGTRAGVGVMLIF